MDQNTGLQENTILSSISNITFRAGSEGSRVIGMNIGSFTFNSTLTTPTNITIEKCRITSNTIISGPTGTLGNITLKKSYIINTSFTSIFANTNTVLNNFTVENCIFEGVPFSNPSTSSTNLIFRNNVVVSYAQLTGYYVANSIFLSSSTAYNFNTCIVRNNIFPISSPNGVPANPGGLTFPDNGTNLFGATIANIIDVATGTADGKFQLVTGGTNPAVGGGVEIGSFKPDCGAFGGNDPYVLSGIPDVPTIYELSIQGGNSVPSGTNSIDIDFSTRSNN